MKTKYLFIAITSLIIFFSSTIEARTVRADFHFFYHSLRHHGTWIEMNDGLVVWRPAVGFASWSPYAQGSWIWTDWGWYWDSSEPFGFIVYHYGRWYFDEYYGWVWVPDYDWAPSWVEWRYDDDYIGWAPLHPFANFKIGFGIVFTRTYVVHHSHWIFVGQNHFCDPYVYNYYVPSKFRYRIYTNTTSRYDYTYEGRRIINRGIDVRTIERKSNTRVKIREIAFNERGTKNEVSRDRDKIEINYDRNLLTDARDNSSFRYDKGDRDFSISSRDVTRQRNDEKLNEFRNAAKYDERNVRKDDRRDDYKDDRNDVYKDDRTKKYERENPPVRDRSNYNEYKVNARKDDRSEKKRNDNNNSNIRSEKRDDRKDEVRNNTSQTPKRENVNRNETKRETETRNRNESVKRKDR